MALFNEDPQIRRPLTTGLHWWSTVPSVHHPVQYNVNAQSQNVFQWCKINLHKQGSAKIFGCKSGYKEQARETSSRLRSTSSTEATGKREEHCFVQTSYSFFIPEPKLIQFTCYLLNIDFDGPVVILIQSFEGTWIRERNNLSVFVAVLINLPLSVRPFHFIT